MTLVTLAAIDEAAERIRGVARTTPLLEVASAGAEPLWVKCENLQAAGAFKIRGAYNTIAQLPEAARASGVITYSSGNHAQAVALAARVLGLAATVVMPTSAPSVKVEGARELGADVIFEGTTSTERRRRAEAEAAARHLTIIQPFDDEQIIAGQGTVGARFSPSVRQSRPSSFRWAAADWRQASPRRSSRRIQTSGSSASSRLGQRR